MKQAPEVVIFKWDDLLPEWVRGLFEGGRVGEDVHPTLGEGWWQDTVRAAGCAREDASGTYAADPVLLLCAPAGEEGEAAIWRINEQFFDYGTPVYMTEVDLPTGRRIVALVTDS